MYATEYIFRAESAWTYKRKHEKLITTPAWTWGEVKGEGTSPSQEREGKERAGRETEKREGKK